MVVTKNLEFANDRGDDLVAEAKVSEIELKDANEQVVQLQASLATTESALAAANEQAETYTKQATSIKNFDKKIKKVELEQ